MKITIKSQNLEINDSDRNYIEEKIIPAIKTYFDDPSTTVDVIAKDINGPKGGIDKEINVIITIAYEKNPIKVSVVGQFIPEAADIAAAKIENILRKIKEKRIDNNRK